MTTPPEFRPSSINKLTVLRQAFGDVEAECVAMCVTNFLACSGVGWKTEIATNSLSAWIRDRPQVNELYRRMLEEDGKDITIKGIQTLLHGGYITREERDGATYFTVTDKFVEVMLQVQR